MKRPISRIGEVLRDRPYRMSSPVARFTEKASHLLPEELRDRFRPLHLKDGVLTVACLSARVAHLIRRHEKDLLDDDVTGLRTMLSTWR